MSTLIPESDLFRFRPEVANIQLTEIPCLLVNCPLTDPTQPYHSIAYLVGAARAAGFTGFRCIDANVDGLNHLARRENVADLLERAAQIRERVEHTDRPTREDELGYRAALGARGLSSDFVEKAIGIFRNPSLFYHHPTYRQATMALGRWQELLCLDGVPKSIADFQMLPGPVAGFSSYRDMADRSIIARLAAPFTPYFRGPFADILRERPWRVVGFSVNYVSQLPFALEMAHQVRAACPDAVIVFGGTEVCDTVRFAKPAGSYWTLYPDVDVIVPGEGETPFCNLLRAIRDNRPLTSVNGILHRSVPRLDTPINYENVADLPAPAFDIWNWDAYWTPEPVVLYSPTRGCYWNKCTFCDYGLNTDRPTSPSRERPVDTVLADLQEIRKIGRTVYFAVDAMSPRYLRMLCDGMGEAGLGMRWSAELRLERTFPKRGMAQRLHQAGCVAVSFGYESGSQRILDLIDKGVRLPEVPAILEDLAANDIGAQMMGFTGFPTETAAEAEQTYAFLREHSEHWTLSGIGTFSLTPGSIVAKDPDRFGVELIPLADSIDIERYLPWRDRGLDVEHWPGEADPRISAESITSITRVTEDRPYVGGIDTAHSLLYFAEFGRKLFPADRFGDPRVVLVPLEEYQTPFGNLERFTSFASLRDRFFEMRRLDKACYDEMMSWLREAGSAVREESRAIILPSGTIFTLPGEVTGSLSARLRSVILASAQARGDA